MATPTYSEWSRQELEEGIARVEAEIMTLQKKITTAEERKALIADIVDVKVKLWDLGADEAYDMSACGAGDNVRAEDFTPSKPKRKPRPKVDKIKEGDGIDEEEFTPTKPKRKSRSKAGGPNKKAKKGGRRAKAEEGAIEEEVDGADA